MWNNVHMCRKAKKASIYDLFVLNGDKDRMELK